MSVTLKVMLEHLEKAKAFSLQTAPRECDSFSYRTQIAMLPCLHALIR